MNSRRNTFDNKTLNFVCTTDVTDSLLIPIKAEKLIFEISFIAKDYLEDLKKEDKLRQKVEELEMLNEMAHIYIKFCIKPCNLLNGRIQKRRILSLDYLDVYKKECKIDDIPINSLCY